MEHAAKGPVFITKYSRPVRVLIDIEEYDRLKARDTRRAYAAEEIPAEWAEALNDVDLSHIDPELNKLID